MVLLDLTHFLPILLLLSYFSWQKEYKLWDRGKLKNYYIYVIAFIMIITSLIFSIFSPHSFFLKDHFILGNIEKTTLPFDILNNSPTFLYFFSSLAIFKKENGRTRTLIIGSFYPLFLVLKLNLFYYFQTKSLI